MRFARSTVLLLLLASYSLLAGSEDETRKELIDQDVQSRLQGGWIGKHTRIFLKGNFVRFTMGAYSYSGQATYSRDYMGYFVDFKYNGRKQIFIIASQYPGMPNDEFFAMVAHDPEPRRREPDIEASIKRFPPPTEWTK